MSSASETGDQHGINRRSKSDRRERVVAGALVTDADAHGRDGRTLEAEPVERLGVYDVHGPVALDQSLNVVDGEFAVTVDDVL